jgi:Fe-S oxidoreductase
MPPEEWLSPEWQAEMEKIKKCLHCGKCSSKCPYGLDTPRLLEENYKDYQTYLK